MKSFFKNSKSIIERDYDDWGKDFLDYSSSPILRADADGELVYINQAFAKMLAYLSKADLQEINLKDELFVDENSWTSFITDLQKKDRLEDYPIELLQKNGSKISIEIDVRNIKNESGEFQYFEGIIAKKESVENKHDELISEINELKEKAIVTEKIQNEKDEKLVEELEELREKEKSASSQVNKAVYTKNVKSQYLANMTHEIKTPLNSIIGFLTLIEQNLFESEEELQDFAHNARTSADSLLEIINNILDISKLEAEKMELDEVEFDLPKEVEKAKTISIPAIGKKDLIIKTNISDELKTTIIGDSLRYRQVLINILTNAIKYTESGSIEISIAIEKERQLSSVIKTTVKDTGIGIPKDQLSQLFKPYTQVKTKKWNKQDGSGLGLMICKELVRLMDGEIVIKSKEGTGTIVEFTTSMKMLKTIEKSEIGNKKNVDTENPPVEIVESPEVKIEPIEKEELQSTPNVDGSKLMAEEVINSSDYLDESHPDVKRILLVEDNPISQKVELKLLKESGYNVDAVSNGFDAIEAVKTNSFNLVLMDVEMAEMDGLESTKRIRALEVPTGKIPIIAVTAHSSMKDREKCLAAGMDDYIAKPININFMKMTIDHWLLKEIEI